MKASLNHIYRTIWSEALGAWVAVSEITKVRSKRSGAAVVRAIRAAGIAEIIGSIYRWRWRPTLLALACCMAFNAHANPTGGRVMSGQASFKNSGSTLTVTNTPGTIINWKSFSIGKSETTSFKQQSASSTVLNRVVTNNPSQILGTLRSNGQVFLINANGVNFGQGSTVDVAGLVVSSLNISNADFRAGNYNFTGTSGAQDISNDGSINARQGGQIYLIAPNVKNNGVINAPNGEIYLAAGHSVQLVNSNDPALRVSITAPAGDAINVGKLVASAGKLGLFGALVRNTGTVSADSATMQGGKIVFRASQQADAGGTISASGATGGGDISIIGDMQSGTTNVTGTLDASAPVSGNGGFIETSAHNLHVADSARITTLAANGQSGTWLIDPADFTIAASGGDMTGATLSTNLGAGNVTILSSSGLINTTGAGDINVNDNVSWSANTLTLTASNNVNINAVMTASGTAGLALNPNTANGVDAASGTGTINMGLNSLGFTGSVNFTGTNTLSINGAAYTIITTLGAAGSVTGTDLQGMNGNLIGNYALGANINASTTSTWNAGAGFVPIGNTTTNFTGNFNGLGHTITGLAINQPSNPDVGLFGMVGATGSIANTGLITPTITGGSGTGLRGVGALAGINQGSINNSYANGGSVSSYGVNVGGLVGLNQGGNGSAGGGTGSTPVIGAAGSNATISNSYVANGTVSGGNSNIGGLVGMNQAGNGGAGAATSVPGGTGGAGGAATISNSYTTGGTVSGVYRIGGLIGTNYGGSAGINNIFAGGAAGIGSVSGSHATGFTITTIAGSGATVGAGGLAGGNYGGTLINSYASNGTVAAIAGGGGFVGINSGAINTSYAESVNVSGTGKGTGGFVGKNWGSTTAASITDSYVNGGTVSGTTNVGGFAGWNQGTSASGGSAAINTSYASGGLVSGTTNIGGFIGNNAGTATATTVIWDSDTTGQLSGIGFNTGGAVAATAVTSSTGSTAFALASYPPPGAAAGFNFTQGTGSWYMVDGSTRPFLQMENSTTITNAHQLQLVNMNPAASYKLDANLNMAATGTTTGMWSSTGFAPIGNPTTAFSGKFDGLGHTISNLTINKPTINNVGLFGVVGGGATVNNVGLVNPNITGANYVGGLAGQVIGGTGGTGGNGFSVSTGVTGTAGLNTTISNSYVSGGSVTGSSYVGGLVGENLGGAGGTGGGGYYGGQGGAGGIGGLAIITADHVAGTTVTAGTSFAGGLVGYNMVGNYGLVGNAFSSGIGGTGGAGGAANISNSYVASGSVTAASYGVGGLVGYDYGTTSNSFFKINTVTTNGGNNVTPGGLYATQYNAWYNGGLLTPLNIANYSTTLVPLGGGSYGISTLAGMKNLLGFADNPAYSFKLTGNIDLLTLPNYYVPTLAASFDGGSTSGFTVSNLSLSLPNDHQALFGRVATGTTISNVALLNANVSGYYGIGTLAGMSLGTISNSHATGTVTGLGGYGTGRLIGGLVGGNAGTIGASYASVNVTGFQEVGGLAGGNVGSINNSYATGNVTGSGYGIGGLVGINTTKGGQFTGPAAITNSYATGTVSGNSSVGGLVGYNGYGTISGSYVSGGSVSGAGYYGGYYVGGLVGHSFGGSISNSYVDLSSVSGAFQVGGLLGADGTIATSQTGIYGSHVSNSTITGTNDVGGLAGFLHGPVSSSYGLNNTVSSGTHTYAADMGGLAGLSYGAISNSYVSGGSVTAAGGWVGGLVGANGSTLPGGTISSSHVYGVSVSGTNSVGGLVGANNGGTINTSYVSGGSVTGTGLYGSNVGGFAGVNSGATITTSFAYGVAVSGITNVGGFVGQNRGGAGGIGILSGTAATGPAATISNSYVNGGSVSGTTNVGGFAGENLGGYGGSGNNTVSVGGTGGAGGAATISTSYASGGLVTGTTYVGGLIGLNVNGANGLAGAIGALGGGGGTASAVSSFWNSTTTPGAAFGIAYDSTLLTGTNTGATPLTSTQMMQSSNFVGFSIANTGGAGATWRNYDGYTTPMLTSFLTPLTVTTASGSKTYDGTAFSGGFGVSYSVAGAVVSGTPIYGGTSQGAINAGTYALSVSGLFSNQLGYDISYANTGTLTVNPRVLTGATIASVTTIYGTVAAAGTVSFTNLVSGDSVLATASIVSPTYSSSGNINAGTYNQIAGTTLSGTSAGNYTFSGVTQTASYTVSPLALTGTISIVSTTYGTTAATGTVSFTNFVSGDSLIATVNIVNPTYSSSGNLNAGTYDQTATTLSGADAGNYTSSVTTAASYNVAKLTLNGAIGPGGNIYGGSFTPGAVTYSNLVTGDSVTSKVSVNTAGNTDSKGYLKVGTYSNIQSVGAFTGTDASNYAIGTFTDGGYTVLALPTVTQPVLNVLVAALDNSSPTSQGGNQAGGRRHKRNLEPENENGNNTGPSNRPLPTCQ